MLVLQETPEDLSKAIIGGAESPSVNTDEVGIQINWWVTGACPNYVYVILFLFFDECLCGILFCQFGLVFQ